MWGIIPAAGMGSRIQPLAFSKELLPVGSKTEAGIERPRAVSEYLIERMIRGGATKLCFVIGPGKCDIVQYYGARVDGAPVAYVVQPKAAGLCDSVFRAAPFVGANEPVLIGLPDTVWFPGDGLCSLPDGTLSFLLFPVGNPHLFDAVETDETGNVREIQVKRTDATTTWVWGAIKMPGRVFHELHVLWQARCAQGNGDEFLGTLVNAYLSGGGRAVGVRAGTSYVDVGTLNGYREAQRLLSLGKESEAS